MRFCPACGEPVGRAIPPDDERERFVCGSCGAIHYHNPKIVVGAVCTWRDRLLLCRRAIEPRSGFWTIPAGYMELGETAEEGAAREAWEEARARIAIEELLAVYSVKRIDQVQLLYRARLLDPEVAAGPESREVRLVGWNEIPWETLAFPTVHWALRRAGELRHSAGPIVTMRNPEPTD
ncbi:NUDIX hydrolase [Geminicoccaceae bacterium 1502E]|nr:NUDIX hydrolase [Geminicoccaceae bacterium 1502E]